MITYGMEIALDPKIPSLLDEGRLLGLGGATFLLIEPSFQGLQDGWQHIIFSIQARGYSVLLAHPERCEHLAETPRMIEQLVECGVHIQVNYGSFLGRYGRAVADSARFLAEKGQIHCIATDSHSYTDLDASGLQTVKDKLLDLIGPDNFQLVSHENPLRVLKGEPLKAMRKNDTGVRSGKARIWSFFRTSDQKHRVQTRTS
jgi:protein-tyrosine phosphatase